MLFQKKFTKIALYWRWEIFYHFYLKWKLFII